MAAILSLFLIITFSILITRIATVALTHTGLSRESARFQARSAFTGVGFTTDESERVVNHPVRRRVLLALMLLGNAGIVSAMSSLILTFVSVQGTTSRTLAVVAIVTGVAFLWTLAQSQWVDRHLERLIDRALRRYTKLDVKDYASLLALSGGYRVGEMRVEPDDWLADRSLADSRLREEGVVVLGIRRPSGEFLGAPQSDTVIRPQDVLVLYGRNEDMAEIDARHKGIGGELRHAEAVAEQEAVVREQSAADPERQASGSDEKPDERSG